MADEFQFALQFDQFGVDRQRLTGDSQGRLQVAEFLIDRFEVLREQRRLFRLSPSRGEAVTSGLVSENLIGLPTVQ